MRLRELVETPIGETEGRRPATIGFAAPNPEARAQVSDRFCRVRHPDASTPFEMQASG